MSEITSRQFDVLVAIARWTDRHGYAPSVRDLLGEIAGGLRSTNAVAEHLERLERKRLIVRAPRVARSVRLTDRGIRAIFRRPAQ